MWLRYINRNLVSQYNKLNKLNFVNYITNTPNDSSAALHAPVLCESAIDYLNPKPAQTFIDMTFGAGGHTKQLFKQCDSIKVYALDRDPVANELAKLMCEDYQGRLIPLLGKFSDLPRLLQQHNVERHSIDGILFDFGCSSMQFDEAERGFSVSKNGPLDMRMDGVYNNDQITAADVLERAEEADLVKILRVYGEEKNAKKIARAIVETRSAFHKIETTKQLADLVANCLSTTITHRFEKHSRSPTHIATKTFQALRIFVNNELNEINYGMLLANEYLRLAGRLVAITFHSLEDMIVKRHLNGNVIEGRANPVPLKYLGHDLTHDMELIESLLTANWKSLTKHVVVPNEVEIMRNNRSRSAKLRAAIKVK